MSVIQNIPEDKVLQIIENIMKNTSDETKQTLNNFFKTLTKANCHYSCIKLLLTDPRVDPSIGQNRAVNFALRNNHIEVIKILLSDPRVDPTNDNNYAFTHAMDNGHLEVIKILLSNPRVNPSAYDDYA